MSTRVRGAHLVGSIPLGSTDEVFEMCGGELGSHLGRIPDGETGDRAADLRLDTDTELYLGLVRRDDPEGNRARVDAATEVAPPFGVATECGLGRARGELDLRSLLRDHASLSQPIR